jgi:Ca2+-binding RTX toxin-like protein
MIRSVQVRETIVLDTGNDFLTGGPGDDTFVFAPQSGVDTILDFGDEPGNEDVIQVEGGIFADFGAVIDAMTQVGQDVVLEFSPTDRLTLRRTSLSDLDASDFLLIA